MLHRILKAIGKLKELVTREQLCEPVHRQKPEQLQETS